MDMLDANVQKQAFADTWTNVAYMHELHMIAEMNKDLFDVLTVFSKTKSINHSAVAYLTTMAIRILYMHKLLKDTGSFYLHCDPTMSHYLKLVCDIIFGERNFQNEIVWKRTTAHNDLNRFGNIHDVILWYSKSFKKKFNNSGDIQQNNGCKIPSSTFITYHTKGSWGIGNKKPIAKIPCIML